MVAAAPPDKITLINDTREKLPLQFSDSFNVIVDTLPVGDIGILGFSDWTNPRFILERKSIPDLVSSLSTNRDRFMRCVEKMRQFDFRALIIEGSKEQIRNGEYLSMMTPRSVESSVDMISVRTNTHVFWCDDPYGAARQAESLARQFIRGVIKNYNLLSTHTREKAGTP